MRKNPHVRICGGLGSATTLVYPTSSRASVFSSRDGSESYLAPSSRASASASRRSSTAVSTCRERHPKAW